MNPNQISELAKTFSTACKDAAKKSKAKTYTAVILLSAITIFLGGDPKGVTWPRV